MSQEMTETGAGDKTVSTVDVQVLCQRVDAATCPLLQQHAGHTHVVTDATVVCGLAHNPSNLAQWSYLQVLR